MRVIELDTLDNDLRRQLSAAALEPVLVTEHHRPVLVVRNLADDDAADELIAQHPDFQDSIRRARQQQTDGQVYTLAELRAAYETTE